MTKLRTIFFLFLLLVLLVPAGQVQARKSPWEIRLPFKSAEIDYQVSGMEKGVERLYVRDYGQERARYRKTKGKIFFKSLATESWEITTPDWVYRIDLLKKKGQKMVNPVKYMKEEFRQLSRKDRRKVEKNAKELGLYFMQAMDGEIEKKAVEILGYQCDRISMKMATVCSISGYDIVLKSESSIAGIKMKTVALKIKKGSVPAKFFTPPPGITITHNPEADRQSKRMAKKVVAMLLDPEAAKKKIADSNTSSPSSHDQQVEKSTAEQEDGKDTSPLNRTMKHGMDAFRGLFGK
jgi:hypothetical protein